VRTAVGPCAASVLCCTLEMKGCAVQFPTVTFVAFFAVVLVGAWALRDHLRYRRYWLIAAGGVFYGLWDLRFLALLTGMVVLTWATGRLMARASPRNQRLLLAGGVTADLLLLGFFKYYGFFVTSLSGALADLGLHVRLPLLQIAVPVGVSFYTFQAISYLIEVRRQRVAAAPLLDVATWLSFFPTITSGPIVRASEFLPQLDKTPELTRPDLSRAYLLIARGLLKKLAFASFFASAITDKTFASPQGFSSLTLLIAIYAYAAQIYCDFSGYTDMAIGISLLLGLRLPENFNRPYTANSVQDFWSRWHMTLSRWLRDYLFAPLTHRFGRRPGGAYASIVVVMLLAGLWHGAAWGFVIFGGVHGTAMALERWRRVHRRKHGRPPPQRTWARQAIGRLITFHVVCVGWVFFATPSLTTAGDMLRGVVTNWHTPTTLITPLLILGIVAVLVAQYVPGRLYEWVTTWARELNPVAQGAAFTAAMVPILAMAPTTVPAFIYYRF